MNPAETRARRVVKAEAARLGAPVVSEVWGHGWEIRIDAPDGFHWAVTQCSQIIAHQTNTGPWGIGELWTMCEDDIKHGLEACDETCGHLE